MIRLKLFLIAMFACGVASAQVPKYTTLYGGVNYNDRLSATGTFHVPAGTTAALSTGGWVRAGALYVDTTGGNKGLYYLIGGVFVRVVDSTQPYPKILNTTRHPSIYYNNGNIVITNGNGIHDSLVRTSVTTLHAYGSSFTLGSFAQDANKIFPKQIRDSLGLTLTNYGANAAGWYKVAKTLMTNNYKKATRNSLVIIEAGGLDAISNKSTELNKNKVQGLLRVSLANCFTDSVFSFGDSRVTNSGFSDTTVGCYSKSLALLDSVQVAYAAGSTLTFSFTGDNLVVYTFATTPGRTMGRFKFTIDGVNGFGGTYWRQYDGAGLFVGAGSYTPADESGLTIYPNAIIIRGLTSAVHSCVITSVDNTATYLDGWAVMGTTSTVLPVAISSIMHYDENADLNYSTTYDKYLNNHVDNLNVLERKTLEDFDGYPVSFVDVNKFYYPSYMVQRPDNLHPKTTGDNAVTSAFLDALKFRRLDDVAISGTGESFPYTNTTATPSLKIMAIDTLTGLKFHTDAGTSGITGTASTNQVAYWTSSSAVGGTTTFIWNSSNELQVGSGTDQGAYKLQVTGDTYHNGALNLSGASSPLQVGGSAGTSGYVLTSAGAGATPTWSAAAGGSQWTTAASDIYYNTGNVGIGVTGPATPLDVRASVGKINLSSTSGTSPVWIQYNNNAGTIYMGAHGSAGNEFGVTGGIAYSTLIDAAGSYPLQLATNSVARITIDGSGNVLIGGTTAGASATKSLALFNGTIPSGNVTDGVQLYAEDVTASSELKVRDEAGNITTLSPHNFSHIPEGPADSLAWSYYSERNGQYINVDMYKAIKTIEQQSEEIEELKRQVAELKGVVYRKKNPVKLIYTGKTKNK